MTLTDSAGLAGAIVLGLVIVLQALLALGRPLGRFAWGGKHTVLPWNLRWASFASFFILGFAAWIGLARAGIAPPGSHASFVRVVSWIFAAFFTVNVATNSASKSQHERRLMTPVSVVLATCFIVVSAG